MEKKFAIASVIVMCIVFAFIFIQHTGGQNNNDAFFMNVNDEINLQEEEELPGDLQTEEDIEEDVEDQIDEDYDNNIATNERSNGMELPIVTITMQDGGVIKLELYPEIAPNTVNNFIHLANDGFYNGLIFHRVISGFMIQGGCPEGRGIGNPGYSIRGEFSQNNFPNDLRHERGVISMARAQHPDSAGSQFFIMHADSFFLDGAYAAFGRVIEGQDVVDRIATTAVANERPVEDQVIQTITVETFGVEFPAPETLER